MNGYQLFELPYSLFYDADSKRSIQLFKDSRYGLTVIAQNEKSEVLIEGFLKFGKKVKINKKVFDELFESCLDSSCQEKKLIGLTRKLFKAKSL